MTVEPGPSACRIERGGLLDSAFRNVLGEAALGSNKDACADDAHDGAVAWPVHEEAPTKRFESGIQTHDEKAHGRSVGLRGTPSVTTNEHSPELQLGVGDVLDGRYILLKRVGSGAAGTVWQARDLERDID